MSSALIPPVVFHSTPAQFGRGDSLDFPLAKNRHPENDPTSGYVHSIETCGMVDGPGVRYIAFLAGCPLRCLYCHNPETQKPRCGTLLRAEEVVADALRYKSFIRKGGMTISGGEPLSQPKFVEALLREAKAAGLHTALDTSGFLGHRASDALLEATDLVLLDIKSSDPLTHQAVTGVSPEPTQRFARRLDRLGKPIWLRFVLVPGLTDDPENIRGVAAFAASLSNIQRCEILPFHQYGKPKYQALGLPYPLSDTPPASPQDLDRARAIFDEFCPGSF